MHSRIKCFIGEPTKNVTFNSQHIEAYEAIPLNIGQLDDIEPVGIDDAISLVKSLSVKGESNVK